MSSCQAGITVPAVLLLTSTHPPIRFNLKLKLKKDDFRSSNFLVTSSREKEGSRDSQPSFPEVALIETKVLKFIVNFI